MSADINLNNIHATVALSGGVDIGLDEIANALTSGVNVDVGLDNIQANANVNADVGLDNIKATANVNADVGLDNVRIKELPVIRTDSKVDLGLDNIRIAQLPPFQFEFSMRPIRVHLPMNYSFCVELFGIRLLKFSVCGEGMAITEDYQPRATERCG